MKTKKIFSALFILAAGYWLPVTALYAEAPNLITYQGRLKENNQPVTGSRNIEIFLCDAFTGGSCHTSNPQSVTVSTGLFRSTFTVPGTVDLSAGNWWLELKVESTVLSPREQLSSVPYSLHSASAAYANNLAAGAGAAAVIASTHIYIVNGASLTVSGAVSANIFYGNGSGLTGVTGAAGTDVTKVLKAGDTMSGSLTILSSAAILAPDTQPMALWVSTSVTQPILAVSTGGRVGIGTALPYADLQVKGPWILGASNAFPTFGVAGWMNSLQGNLLEGGGGSWANHFVSYGGGDIARFGASASSGAAPDVKVVVTNAGKVGIATGAPQGLFQVGPDIFTALSGGNVGIGTAVPMSKLDVLNGSITIRGAQAGLVFEDAGRVISSETAAGLGAGIRVSTNVYIVGFSSAAKYYGDGSALTGVAAGSALNVTGIVALSHGGTGADLSSSGGPNQFVRQNSAGGVFGVSAIADADVPDTITLADLTQVTNRNHSVLTSTGANTHAQLDAHLALTGAAHGATAANTNSAIVARDASGGFSAGAITVSSITATNASGISAAQIIFAGNVAVSSETSFAFGSGIRVSTNVYMVGFSSAARYYGDGSALTGVAAALVPAAGVQNGVLGGNVITSSVGLSGFYSALPVRANLGLAIGTNVQAWDADLDDLADGSLTGSKVGSGVPAANIADGALGANVLASSASVNSIYDNAISGVSASKLSGNVPAGNLGNAVLKSGDTMTGQLTISVVPSQPSALITNGVVISSGGVIQTTGTGYGFTSGDPRGFGAVDLQAIRSAAGQVASGQYSALGGGGYNTASGFYSTVGGGASNTAGGKYSTVPGGYRNTATGDFSFAAGYQSTAAANGAFAWKDSDPADSLLNDVADQVRFKAKGGFWVSTSPVYSSAGLFVDANNNVGIGTTAPGFKLHVAGSGGTIAGLSTSANSTDAAVYGWANSGATAVKGVSIGGGYAGRFEGNVFITDKVGIGNTNLNQALVVNGAVTVGDTIGFTTGTIRYNTAAGNHFQGYNGASWVNFDVSGGGWTAGAGTIYPGALSDLVGIGVVPAGHKLQVYDNNSTLGQHGIYSRIYPNSGIPTTSYGFDGSKSAVAGVADSNGGVTKVFGVAGYLNGAGQTDSAGVFGGADRGAAGTNPVTWGALGYRDTTPADWAGYFKGNSYFSGNIDMYNGGSNALLNIGADGAGGVGFPVITTRMKNTTGNVLPGMILFSLYANGYNTPFPGYQPAAQISVVADANTGDAAADMPGRIEFATTPDGTGAPTTRMVIKSSGAVGIGITNPTARLEVLETDTSGGAYILKVGTASSSPSLAVSTDGAVFVSGELRARVWQRIFSADLASNMNTFVIPNLRGNTDAEYKLIVRLSEGVMGLCTVKLQPNADVTPGNYNSQWYGATGPAAVNHVVNTGTLDSIPVATVGTGGLAEQASLIEGTLIARGNPRIYSGTMVSITQQTTRQIGGTWNGGAAEITSLQINTDLANCLGAGTHIELWAFR